MSVFKSKGNRRREPKRLPQHELTDAAIEYLTLRARVDQVDVIVAKALGSNRISVPIDVLLDIKVALHPRHARSSVPMPGPGE